MNRAKSESVSRTKRPRSRWPRLPLCVEVAISGALLAAAAAPACSASSSQPAVLGDCVGKPDAACALPNGGGGGGGSGGGGDSGSTTEDSGEIVDAASCGTAGGLLNATNSQCQPCIETSCCLAATNCTGQCLSLVTCPALSIASCEANFPQGVTAYNDSGRVRRHELQHAVPRAARPDGRRFSERRPTRPRRETWPGAPRRRTHARVKKRGRWTAVTAVALAAAVAVALASSTGCSSAALPGQMLGTYKVVGQPQTNTCGLSAPNPWTFDVELSENQAMLYWDWLDGSPLLSGPVAAQAATITDHATVNADSTDAGLGPCTLNTTSTLQVNFGAGNPPGDFAATLSYSYTPASGATCTDVLTSSGGMYDQLPCTVTYTASATRQ